MSKVTFNWSNLPSPYCWTGPQQYMDDILSRVYGTLPGGVNLIVSDTQPDAQFQGDVWVKTVGGNNIEGFYLFEGAWKRPHPIPPSSPERMIWTGTEADLWAYGGGDGSNPDGGVTDTTGPMWVVDTVFDFRVPLGIGRTNIGTSDVAYSPDPATIVSQGATGGSEKVVIDPVNHVHCFGRMGADSGNNADDVDLLIGTTTNTTGTVREIPGASNSKIEQNWGDVTGASLVTKPQEKITGGVPDSITQDKMIPYVAVAFCKRTNRIWILG